jgi:hypothetical protein
MSDHPILFSGLMVRAILDGRKTMTRRVLKPQPMEYRAGGLDVTRPGQDDDGVWGQTETVWEWAGGPHREPDREIWHPLKGVRWAPGDRLWVREAFAVHANAGPTIHQKGDGHPWGSPIYKATFGAALDPRCEGFTRWTTPIHMPRWASRITLEVDAVRVERLQDITEADAEMEGIQEMPRRRVMAFTLLWNELHGEDHPHSWDANPWVSVTTFRRVGP